MNGRMAHNYGLARYHYGFISNWSIHMCKWKWLSFLLAGTMAPELSEKNHTFSLAQRNIFKFLLAVMKLWSL